MFLVAALSYGQGRMGIHDSGHELGYGMDYARYSGQTGGPEFDVADRGVKNLRCSLGGMFSCLQFRGGFVGAGIRYGFTVHSETLIYTRVMLSGLRSSPLEYYEHSTMQTYAELCLRVQKSIGQTALAIEAGHEIRLAEMSFDHQDSHLEFEPFRIGLVFSCPLTLFFSPPDHSGGGRRIGPGGVPGRRY